MRCGDLVWWEARSANVSAASFAAGFETRTTSTHVAFAAKGSAHGRQRCGPGAMHLDCTVLFGPKDTPTLRDPERVSFLVARRACVRACCFNGVNWVHATKKLLRRRRSPTCCSLHARPKTPTYRQTDRRTLAAIAKHRELGDPFRRSLALLRRQGSE